MNALIERVVVLSEKITVDVTAVDALHYTQAILNLANSVEIIRNVYVPYVKE